MNTQDHFNFISLKNHLQCAIRICSEMLPKEFRSRETIKQVLVEMLSDEINSYGDFNESQLGPGEYSESTIKRIRHQFPNAYKAWSTDEEKLLTLRFQEGFSIDELATLYQRQPSAIRSRLRKLGILKD